MGKPKRSQRIANFREQKAKEPVGDENNQSLQLFQILMGLINRVGTLENQMQHIVPKARVADWRSLSLMEVLGDKRLVPVEEVIKRGQEIQINEFEKLSDVEDKRMGLEPANDAIAEKGHFAISHIKFFKGGNEVLDSEIIRSKIELGKHESFPELDDAIVGLKVGESINFPLNLLGETDEARVTLIGLRKRTKEETSDEKTPKAN